MYWYEKEGQIFSPVISTRVRFARNLNDTPFPHRMDPEARVSLWNRICNALTPYGSKAVSFDQLNPLEKTAYVETRLASPALTKAGTGAGLILSPEGDVSVMVNEEDHLRIQAIYPGKAVDEAFEAATLWCKRAEKDLPVAYRKGLGYLTSCPTNLGAGCRISVMIHLPALRGAGAMNGLTENLNNAGFTVRGIFGEGSREEAGIYQISNQLSREKSPDQIRDSFLRMLADLEERERNAASLIYNKYKDDLEDKICRAIGTVKFARKMSYGEFSSLYALIRFGKALGLEEARKLPLTDRLLIELMPAPMILGDAENRDEAYRDLARAKTLRKLTN